MYINLVYVTLLASEMCMKLTRFDNNSSKNQGLFTKSDM